MMIFVFDGDVLSTFSKIKRFDLIPLIFGKSLLLISPFVKKDLEKSKTPLFGTIISSGFFTETSLTEEEKELCKKIYSEKSLGLGEVECITICIKRKAHFVSNDSRAIKYAENLRISTINLETMLYMLKDQITSLELKGIIMEIETKDRVRIVNKNKLLN